MEIHLLKFINGRQHMSAEHVWIVRNPVDLWSQ